MHALTLRPSIATCLGLALGACAVEPFDPCAACPPGQVCGIDDQCRQVCSAAIGCGDCSVCVEGVCTSSSSAECTAACGPEVCAQGCCEAGQCQAVSSRSCGRQGAACVDCTADPRADSCSASGECVCAAIDALCPVGTSCTPTACTTATCNAGVCAQGCCEAGQCQAVSSRSCGRQGAACVDCTADLRADSCSASGACVCAAIDALCPVGTSCASSGCISSCSPQCAGKCGGTDGCGGVCPDDCQAPNSCGGGGVATECGAPAGDAACALPWGGTVSHGESVTAYVAASVACGSVCSSEARTCADGMLSGANVHASCSVETCGEPGLDFVHDPFTIPSLVGLAQNTYAISETITVTGLSPFITVRCTATGSGYVSAGTDVVTGTYGPATDPFPASADGTFVLRAMGIAAAPPGESVQAHIGISTYTGYGPTFVSGDYTVTSYSITTSP